MVISAAVEGFRLPRLQGCEVEKRDCGEEMKDGRIESDEMGIEGKIGGNDKKDGKRSGGIIFYFRLCGWDSSGETWIWMWICSLIYVECQSSFVATKSASPS